MRELYNVLYLTFSPDESSSKHRVILVHSLKCHAYVQPLHHQLVCMPRCPQTSQAELYRTLFSWNLSSPFGSGGFSGSGGGVGGRVFCKIIERRIFYSTDECHKTSSDKWKEASFFFSRNLYFGKCSSCWLQERKLDQLSSPKNRRKVLQGISKRNNYLSKMFYLLNCPGDESVGLVHKRNWTKEEKNKGLDQWLLRMRTVPTTVVTYKPWDDQKHQKSTWHFEWTSATQIGYTAAVPWKLNNGQANDLCSPFNVLWKALFESSLRHWYKTDNSYSKNNDRARLPLSITNLLDCVTSTACNLQEAWLTCVLTSVHDVSQVEHIEPLSHVRPVDAET